MRICIYLSCLQRFQKMGDLLGFPFVTLGAEEKHNVKQGCAQETRPSTPQISAQGATQGSTQGSAQKLHARVNAIGGKGKNTHDLTIQEPMDTPRFLADGRRVLARPHDRPPPPTPCTSVRDREPTRENSPSCPRKRPQHRQNGFTLV